MNNHEPEALDAWTRHERSQLLYFRSLSLQQKMEAVEAMADLVRHFEKMRVEGAFRPAVPHSGRQEQGHGRSAVGSDVDEPHVKRLGKMDFKESFRYLTETEEPFPW